MKIQDIQATLARMAELLRVGGIDDWAAALETLGNEMAIDQVRTSGKILSMYGGMGSLNDLILYKDGQPLVKENVELDSLRVKLHTLCHE